jgi:hypothetical protein
MSGEYRDEQNITIEATDNPELAKRYGLTQFDKATGQYRRPKAPDAGQRDGKRSEEQYREALDLAGEQHEAERARLEAEIEMLRADAAPRETKATKATGSKAADHK